MSDVRTQGNFDISRVVEQTFKTISRNIVVFGVLALVLGAAPYVFFTLINAGNLKALTAGGNPAAIMAAAGKYYMIAPFHFLMGIALNAGLIFCAYEDMSGRTATPADIVVKMLRTVLPLLGLLILEILALGFGFVLLVVPGVMMLCAWAVITPALVIEGRSVFGSFSRSAELTRGVRWRVLGLLVIYLIAAWIISAIGGLVMIGSGGLNLFRPNLAVSLSIPSVLFNAVMQAVYAMVTAAGSTAMFVQLRQAREGAPKDQVLDAFS